LVLKSIWHIIRFLPKKTVPEVLLHVKIHDDNDTECLPKIEKKGDCYNVKYTPKAPAALSVDVFLAREPVSGSPFPVQATVDGVEPISQLSPSTFR